jgi:transposase
MVSHLTGVAQDWRRLDERIAAVSTEIEALAERDESCQRLMTVPGVGPIISSAVVVAIGNGAGFKQGRDFGAWLGLVPKQESGAETRAPILEPAMLFPPMARAPHANRDGVHFQ